MARLTNRQADRRVRRIGRDFAKQAAQAFTIALEAQPGIESIDLVSMMPFEEAITAAVAAGKAAVAATGYTGPGPAVP